MGVARFQKIKETTRKFKKNFPEWPKSAKSSEKSRKRPNVNEITQENGITQARCAPIMRAPRPPSSLSIKLSFKSFFAAGGLYF